MRVVRRCRRWGVGGGRRSEWMSVGRGRGGGGIVVYELRESARGGREEETESLLDGGWKE
jgi:hypothetical protein